LHQAGDLDGQKSDTLSHSGGKGKDRSQDDSEDILVVNTLDGVQGGESSSSSSSQPTVIPAIVVGGPSTFMPSFGLPSPEYEIQESPLDSALRAEGKGKKKVIDQSDDETTRGGLE
jgi:hypothetical protein